MKFISPWIHTTDRCNLRCHYCYVKGRNTITRDKYQDIQAFLLREKANRIHLRFAGGEPTLVFDIWKPFALSMLEKKNVAVEVLTNFVEVPDNFWKFAEHERVNVSVSLDAGKKFKVLDKAIVEKLSRLRNPWIMTTVTKENINELFLLAYFIGTNNYGWCLTTDYFEESVPEIEKLSAVLVNIVKILKETNYDFNRISFNNFSLKESFTGCRAGNEMCAIDYKGDIYTCQTRIGKGTPIGNVKTGYIKITPRVKIHCKDCILYGFCKGWCPLYYKTPNPLCGVIKIFASEVLQSIKKEESRYAV